MHGNRAQRQPRQRRRGYHLDFGRLRARLRPSAKRCALYFTIIATEVERG